MEYFEINNSKALYTPVKAVRYKLRKIGYLRSCSR